jgi:hypothetical protein
MSVTTPTTRRRLLVPATVAAAALEATIGVLQLFRTDDATGVHTPATHVLLTLFAVALLAAIPLWSALGERVGARWAGWAVAAGNVLLAFGSTASNINGGDPGFFAPVAAAANLALLVGLIALAVLAVRRRALPVWTAVVVPVYFLGIIPFSQFGGGVLRAAVLLVVGWALTAGLRRG